MNRYTHCLFCDDVRIEAGNKTSLMGLYSGVMEVPAVPMVLPKLCFFVIIGTPIDNPFRTLAIRIFDEDHVLIEQNFGEAELASGTAEAIVRGEKNGDVNQLTVGITLIAAPYVIEKNHTLVVKIIADGEEMTSGRLHVKVSSPQ